MRGYYQKFLKILRIVLDLFLLQLRIDRSFVLEPKKKKMILGLGEQLSLFTLGSLGLFVYLPPIYAITAIFGLITAYLM